MRRGQEDDFMPVDPKRVQAVFQSAVKVRDLAARATLVARELRGDSALLQQVEALLRAHAETEGDLDQQVIPGESLVTAPPTEHVDEGEASDPGAPIDATRDHTPSPGQTNRQVSRPITEGPGTRIGPYKLREKIGEAGWESFTWLSRRSRSGTAVEV
jgi:hypothetical protein